MSEQYYQKEDQLEETPEQAIENFQAQSNSLATVVPDVALALQQGGEALGQLYQQAQEAGNTGAMALISAAYERMEFTANATVQMDAVRESAAAAIATINEDRQRVVEQLDELETAIHYQDDTHPQIKDLVQAVRDDVIEEVMDQAQEDAYEYIAESTYDQLHEDIAQITGCTWEQINRFIGYLQGDYEISELQSAQLKEFIEGLSIERDGAE